MQKKYWGVIAISLFAATLTGCGSSGSGGDSTIGAGGSGGSGSSFTTDSDSVTIGANAVQLAGHEDDIEVVGADKCIDCHGDVVAAARAGLSWSLDEVAGYLTGAHVIHSTSITQARAQAEGCNVCHDPIGDGVTLEGLIDSGSVPEDGLAAVTCEACHGAGGEHYGISALPTPNPDHTVCALCHDALPEGGHITYHPEANNIGTNFAASKHNTASIRNTAVCAKCHTDEGGRLYKNVTTRAQLNASVLPVETGSAVQCRTCHDSHDVGNELLLGVIEEGHGSYPPYDATAEYATCTACHQGDNAGVIDELGATNLTTGGAATDPGLLTELIYHGDAHMRVITDTHYDDPDTADQIEGYVVDRNGTNVRPCLDCHDIHAVQEIRLDRDTTTINDQWALSGHGGRLLAAKDAVLQPHVTAETDREAATTQAMKAAFVDNTSPWSHYDWDASNRQSCQMCHTATGAKNYLTDPAGYDKTANDFSHLEGWAKAADDTVTSSDQNEMLYCWGCHSDNAGGLRTNATIPLDYTVDGVTVSLTPPHEDSSVCLHCHSGRGNMDSLLDGATANPAGAAVTGGTKTHYLTAGGIIHQSLTRIGYEYAGQNYEDKSYFAHDDLGCAECHMTSAESHSLTVAEKNGSGEITALTSTRCVECHDGERALFVAAAQVGETVDLWNGSAAVATTVTQAHADAAAVELQHEAHGYHNALEALAAALTAAGTAPQAGYPYFGGAATDQGHGGAMHNYGMLHHEPGAYAHNRYYTKRLIFDSIDWLTSGAAGARSLDGSITLDPVTYAAAIEWFGGDADTGVIATRP